MLSADACARWRAARPFVVVGGLAILAGGLLAAAVAHQPGQRLVWLAAYLVLVVGCAQAAFGAGQAALHARAPGARRVAWEWGLFNLGSAGVIGGTLRGAFGWVLIGTVLFAAACAMFLLTTTRGSARRGWLATWRILLALVLAGSLIGLGLSASRLLGNL